MNCGRANAHVNGMNLREIDRLEKENAALKAEMVGKVLVDKKTLIDIVHYVDDSETGHTMGDDEMKEIIMSRLCGLLKEAT